MPPIEPLGATVQFWVPVGECPEAKDWYEQLFARPPDFRPFDDDSFIEGQFRPGFWEVHVAETDEPGIQHFPFRFGVSDIVETQNSLIESGIKMSEIDELTDIVKWCNFEDPWGNQLDCTKISLDSVDMNGVFEGSN